MSVLVAGASAAGPHVRNGVRLVVCDATCRAAPGGYAAGDVARWYRPGLGGHLRLENRTNVTAQAGAVAGSILGDERDRFVARYDQAGRAVAVLGWNMPEQARQHSRALDQGRT